MWQHVDDEEDQQRTALPRAACHVEFPHCGPDEATAQGARQSVQPAGTSHPQ